jgi:hypothetical protein
MTRLSRLAAAPSAAAVLAALCFLAWPLLAGAQGGRTEVTIDHTQQAVLKTDVRIGDFRALSAGRNVQGDGGQAARGGGQRPAPERPVQRGRRPGFKPAELPFSWTIEATVEGAAAGDWPVTVNLNLLTWARTGNWC